MMDLRGFENYLLAVYLLLKCDIYDFQKFSVSMLMKHEFFINGMLAMKAVDDGQVFDDVIEGWTLFFVSVSGTVQRVMRCEPFHHYSRHSLSKQQLSHQKSSL